MVVWLIGLSASGKTTLGREVFHMVRRTQPNTVFLDGDVVRSVLGDARGHTVAERKKNAESISRLCLELDGQGHNVVCCILSAFQEHRDWNRLNLSDYREVYVDVTPDTLLRREFKGLYLGGLAGTIPDVVGLDIPFEVPAAPDLVVRNDEDLSQMAFLARAVVEELLPGSVQGYPYTARDLLTRPEKYEFSRYEGRLFLEGYESNRGEALEELDRLAGLCQPDGVGPRVRPARSDLGDADDIVHTERFLDDTVSRLGGDAEGHDLGDLSLLLQRFEVSKRVYAAYDPGFRKRAGESWDDLYLYARLGEAFGLAAGLLPSPARLPFVNGLLKVNDILISRIGQVMTSDTVRAAARAIRLEQVEIARLGQGVTP